jgi:F-type H+-transporting ATPase subunit epsilon
MAEKIQLEVVTPEQRVLAEPVDMVTVPGLGGEIGILPGHTPLISQLQNGLLT